MTLYIPAGMKVLLAGSSHARALGVESLDSVEALRAAVKKAVHPELNHKVPSLP